MYAIIPIAPIRKPCDPHSSDEDTDEDEDNKFAYYHMTLTLGEVVGELKRIASHRKYMRSEIVDLAARLDQIRIYMDRWRYYIKRDSLQKLIYALEILCKKLENYLMRRRRMREALIEVAYQLDHIKNKMKCNLMVIK